MFPPIKPSGAEGAEPAPRCQVPAQTGHRKGVGRAAGTHGAALIALSAGREGQAGVYRRMSRRKGCG